MMNDLDPKQAGDAHLGMGWTALFKGDKAGAKSHAERARAEGQNVDKLVRQIEMLEKAPQQATALKAEDVAAEAAPRVKDIGTLVNQLRTGASAAKVAACRELSAHGAAAVQFLSYAVRADRDRNVKVACAGTLEKMGPVAKGAAADLRAALNDLPTPKPLANAAEQAEQAKWDAVGNAIGAAIRSIER